MTDFNLTQSIWERFSSLSEFQRLISRISISLASRVASSTCATLSSAVQSVYEFSLTEVTAGHRGHCSHSIVGSHDTHVCLFVGNIVTERIPGVWLFHCACVCERESFHSSVTGGTVLPAECFRLFNLLIMQFS